MAAAEDEMQEETFESESDVEESDVDVFGHFDKNNDGLVSQAEFKALWDKRGWTRFDKDKDGKLRRSEYESIKYQLQPVNPPEFDLYDEDDNGSLSHKEANKLFEDVLDKYWWRNADVDGDSFLSRVEFEELVDRMVKRPVDSEL